VRKPRGRPLKGDTKRIRTSFTLPPEQIAWLEEEARILHSTKSDLLSRCVNDAQYGREAVSKLLRTRFHISHKTLTRLCERYSIKTFSLFGSILTKKFGPESDIDILVEFDEKIQPTFFTLTRLEEEIAKLLSPRTIDLKTPRELSRYFRAEVVREAEVLYAA